MSVLTGPEIRRVVEYTRFVKENGYPSSGHEIEIDPFDSRPTADGGRVGPNSYDLALADDLVVYTLSERPEAPRASGHVPRFDGDVDWEEEASKGRWYLDPNRPNPTFGFSIGPGGHVLVPGELYLGSTVERVAARGYVPWIDGRSSVGRLGIRVHATAGRGDDGFDGRWTLEIDVVKPVRVYAGMRIAQMTFMTMVGGRDPYRGRYQNQPGAVPSRFHLRGELP